MNNDLSSLRIEPTEPLDLPLLEDRPSGTLNLQEVAAQLGLSEEFLADQSNHKMPYQDSSDQKRYFDLLSVARFEAHIADVRRRVEADQRRAHQQAVDDVREAVRRAQMPDKKPRR